MKLNLALAGGVALLVYSMLYRPVRETLRLGVQDDRTVPQQRRRASEAFGINAAHAAEHEADAKTHKG